MITFSEPILQHGPGHVKHYYIHFFKDNQPIPDLVRGDSPQEVIERAKILKEKLEQNEN